MKATFVFFMFEIFLLGQVSNDPHSLDTESKNSPTGVVRVRALVKVCSFQGQKRNIFNFLIGQF